MEQYKGHKVYVRAITYHWVGRVVEITPREIYLSPARLVFESGDLDDFNSPSGEPRRWHQWPDSDKLPVCIVRSAIVDVMPFGGPIGDE